MNVRKQKCINAVEDYDKLIEDLKDKFPIHNQRPSSSSSFSWKSKDGRYTQIQYMATQHIVNVIKMIEEGRHVVYKRGSNMYQSLIDELNWRQKIVKEYNQKTKYTKREDGSLFLENDVDWS